MHASRVVNSPIGYLLLFLNLILAVFAFDPGLGLRRPNDFGMAFALLIVNSLGWLVVASAIILSEMKFAGTLQEYMELLASQTLFGRWLVRKFAKSSPY
jgi:hypothetical protein